MYKSVIQISKLFHLLLILPLILIASNSQVFTQEERIWKTFSPANGDWSILAPGVMKPDSEAIKSKSHKGSHSYNDSTGFFSVIYRDEPRRYVPWKPNYKAYFQKIRDDAVKAVKGQLISDAEYRNDNIVGHEIYIKMPEVTIKSRESYTKTTYRVERARMFFHGKRFYVLLVVLPEEQIDTSIANNYLNSFALN